MEDREYVERDATGLAALIAAGEVSVAEVRAAATRRYRDTNAKINAVVEWYDDPDPPSSPDGPFHGLPILRKDAGATEAGRLTEMGSRLMAGHRAEVTSPYFERIRDAGIQVLGRSAVPEFAQHGTTESFALGPTRNPLDLDHSSGGSSGGAASAILAGVVPVAHATDAAGSIRIPASVTGLVGLKPTRGLVPPSADRWNGLLSEFVLTRSVRDARRFLHVLAGVPPVEPPAWSARIAWSADHWAGSTVEPAVAAEVERAAGQLVAAGHVVEPIASPFDYERLMTTWLPLFEAGVAAAVHLGAIVTGRPIDERYLEPFTLGLLDRVKAMPPEAPHHGLLTAAALATDLDRRLDGFDALLTPTLDRSVIPLGRMAGDCPLDRYLADTDDWFDRLYLANVTGWPAISVPVVAPGRADGAWSDTDRRPIGVQLMARPHHERKLLALADELLDGTIVPVAL